KLVCVRLSPGSSPRLRRYVRRRRMDAARNVACPCSRSVTGRRRFIMTLVSRSVRAHGRRHGGGAARTAGAAVRGQGLEEGGAAECDAGHEMGDSGSRRLWTARRSGNAGLRGNETGEVDIYLRRARANERTVRAREEVTAQSGPATAAEQPLGP